jgi:hypothetical protein
LPASATVTTRTIHALPIITPSIVSMARNLLARSAWSARLHVSLHNIGMFRKLVTGIFTRN